MTYRLSPKQIAVIYNCPTCGADVHEHNDYYRTERGICSKGAHSARVAAIEALVTEIVTEQRALWEEQFACSATVSWGRCGFTELCDRGGGVA